MDMQHFLRRLPAELAATFEPEQLAAIELHFAMRHRARHALDWRWRLRVPGLSGMRCYLVLLAGCDRCAG
jgi:hypothetical protein